jgi:hypothetical protein
MVGPLEGADGDPEASTTYVGDVDGGPLGGVVEDPGAPTIDAKKHRQRGPRPLWGVQSPSGIRKVCCKPAWVS